MKQLSINRIQFNLLAVLLIFYTCTVLSYRVFIERPALEKNMILLSEREVSTLKFSAENMINSLNLITRDHAVWTSTYQFMKEKDPQFLIENMTEDTFSNLRIDGYYLFDQDYNTVASFAYNHSAQINIDFKFNDFIQFPHHKKIFPHPITDIGAPQKSGILLTQHGVAIYSAVQIRDSAQGGENRGYLVFLRLINRALFEELSTYIFAEVTYAIIDGDELPPYSIQINEDPKIETVRTYSHLYVPDVNAHPLLLISIKHSNNTMPPIFDLKGALFISVLVVLVILVYQILAKFIVKPIKLLAEEIKAVANSQHIHGLTQQYHVSELSYIATSFNQLVSHVNQQTKLLEQQAHIDELTQIPNRRRFEEVFSQHAQLFMRIHAGFALIMADVDHFKKYNDVLGHVEGDHALVAVAQTLKEHCQRENDICARYGGEEFIMLIHDINEHHLKIKLQQIITAFKTTNIPHPASPTAPYLTVSLGAYIINSNDIVNYELPFKATIKKVDTALYQAKDAGRNRAIIYNNTVTENAKPDS